MNVDKIEQGLLQVADGIETVLTALRSAPPQDFDLPFVAPEDEGPTEATLPPVEAYEEEIPAVSAIAPVRTGLAPLVATKQNHTPDSPQRPAPAAYSMQIGSLDSWWNKKLPLNPPVWSGSEGVLARLQTNMKRWHSYGPSGDGGYYWMPRLEINGKVGEPYGNHVNFITSANDFEVTWHQPVEYTLDGPYDPHGDYLLMPYHPTFNLQEFGDSSDSHLYVVDLVRRQLREYYRVRNYTSSGIAAGKLTSGVCRVYPLDEPVTTAPARCTSANAAGSVYAPLLLTPADFASGVIGHAVPLTLNNDVPAPYLFMGPHASHTPIREHHAPGGKPVGLPYGSRIVLRKDFDLTRIKNDNARTVYRAAQEYGFYHIDGINGDTSIPCAHDLNYSDKYQDLGVSPFDMFYGEGLPEWDKDFFILDGEVGDMRDGRPERVQIDERVQ